MFHDIQPNYVFLICYFVCLFYTIFNQNLPTTRPPNGRLVEASVGIKLANAPDAYNVLNK